MRWCPGKLPLQDGYAEAQVAEDAHARPQCRPQKAHREQPHNGEKAQKAGECYLACTGYGHLYGGTICSALLPDTL